MWYFIIAAVLVTESTSLSIPSELADEWNKFKSEYNKQYLNDFEESKRFQAYLINKLKVLEHNKLFERGLSTYRQSINQFSDMIHEDFVKLMTGFKPGNITLTRKFQGKLDRAVANSVDWRDYGFVTAVKNQGQCGSCWAFSATGVLEGQHFNKTGVLVPLSEQNLLDCTPNSSCNGGTMHDVFLYALKNGVNPEKSYPYEAAERLCRYDPSNNVVTARKFYVLPRNDERALMEMSYTLGPISVAFDASLSSFQRYQGGVYDDPRCSSSQVNHAALLVGYGSENGREYWIVKNSWGSTWGERGYVKIARNKNMCGIATMPMFAFV